MADAGLPDVARHAVGEYVERLGEALPDAVQGVYLTGSAALGDWLPERSDLDLLTVTLRPLGEADLDALADLHSGLAGRPNRDAVYVCCDDLGAKPRADGGPKLPYAVDGIFHRDGQDPDPVLWATLDRGVAVVGTSVAELGVAPDPRWLRSWNLGNLESYWRSWSADARPWVSALQQDETVPGEIVVWAALGPGRLHCTIATGEIISKTAAADYTAQRFPAYADLLARAKAWRLGDDTAAAFTAFDGLAACDLIDAVIADAARL